MRCIVSSLLVSFLAFSIFTTNAYPTSANAVQIKPFTTDGCSVFPDGTFQQDTLWLSCCTAHDYAYWQGGTYEQREIADEQLHQCVTAAGEPNIATLMLMGVRLGGTPYSPLWFRWGYGWPYPRLYQPLTDDEIKQIKIQSRNEKE